MARFADDLFSNTAAKSDRLRLLQWTLYGLVLQLDEEGVYGVGWIGPTAAEIQSQLENAAVVQELLGHSDIRVTRGYTHVSSPLTQDAAARLGQALFRELLRELL